MTFYCLYRDIKLIPQSVLPIPDLVTPNKELADAIKPIHAIGAWSLVILIVLHVGAALKHQFIDKDNLISRMNPFSKK